MKTHPQRFVVCNCTDQIMAHPERMSMEEAEAFVQSFASRFARQGYYLTAAGERIPAGQVDLEIVEVGPEEPLPPEQTAAQPSRQR